MMSNIYIVDVVSVNSESSSNSSGDMFPNGEIYMCQCDLMPFSSHCCSSEGEPVERCQSHGESVRTAKIEAEN